MEDYKVFTGKSLDEAMAAACDYFGLGRGKLEIEILSDAKTGIFGLVGAKKATVRARKANIETVNLRACSERQDSGKKSAQPSREKPATQGQSGKNSARTPKEIVPKAEKPAPHAPTSVQAPVDEKQNMSEKKTTRPEKRTETADKHDEKRPNDHEHDKGKNDHTQQHQQRKRIRQPRPDKPAQRPDGPEEKFPEIPLESMDLALLETEVLTAVDFMTSHIVGETGKEFKVSGGKARVRVDSGEDSGLLIGRDGQTLAALQYLASCIVSRRMGASVRVQIDAGDYRSRQLEKLKTTALELADKVRKNGRPQSTRPMSAYLRRAVHMALADDPDVQTHSKGEGSLKRVVIVPKKK